MPHKKKSKTISFNEWDARNIYEWWLALNQGIEVTKQEELMCICCPLIAKRLEKFIGAKEARDTRKAVKENPYFIKL